MAQKPAIPKGTRDFLPLEVARRTYIFDTIKNSFKKYGFAPIETPSFELSTTLMGKYGEDSKYVNDLFTCNLVDLRFISFLGLFMN